MKKALRASLVTFTGDPFLDSIDKTMHYIEDAILIIENSKIISYGTYSEMYNEISGIDVTHYENCLITAGFIDSHIHYPQTQIIASYGEQLIDWLNRYTFPEEQSFSDKNHSKDVSEFFINELFRNGITTAAVYCTVYPESVNALFETAAKYNMRVMAGKVCMDRNAPAKLLDTAQSAYDDSRILINKWHKNGRAEYIITPRFAPTSTPEQLEMLGSLATEFPDTLIQSHLSENLNEIKWVKDLFPLSQHYTDVYYKYNLLRKKSIYGHCVHLDEDEFQLFYETGASISHCPTSNLFLGSGCFDIKKAKNRVRPVKVGLGTDVGGGTTFSMFQVMNEAYKTAQLNGNTINAAQLFYLATKGAAESLGIDDKVGSISKGMEADLIVIDINSTPLIKYRMQKVENVQDILFSQIILADDRAIKAVYIAGKKVYNKN